jgi:hypothetical protein
LLWRSIAIASERTETLYRQARAKLPANADFWAGDGIASHLFDQALRPYLSGHPLSNSDALLVEKYWPGLIGNLRADAAILEECEKLRRGEILIAVPRKGGQQELRSLFSPKWLSRLQEDVSCDVGEVRAELEIEYAKAAQYAGERIHLGEAEPVVVSAGTPPRYRLMKDEANIKARKFLAQNPNATARELSKGIGCALGTVSKLPAWQAVKEQLNMGRHPP